MMARMKRHEAGGDGWSEWDQPVMRGYRMCCCDCGLVHDMEFIAFEVTKRFPNGSYEMKELPIDRYQVRLRARRNNRSTAQVRRHRDG